MRFFGRWKRHAVCLAILLLSSSQLQMAAGDAGACPHRQGALKDMMHSIVRVIMATHPLGGFLAMT